MPRYPHRTRCATVAHPMATDPGQKGSLPVLRKPSMDPGALQDGGRSAVPSMPTIAPPKVDPKERVVYIASYGHQQVIFKHLQKVGWAVPMDRIVTPSCFPGYRDGHDMGDGKFAMLRHIAGLQPGMALLLVDDSRRNVTCTREGGWNAVKVHGRRGIDLRCLERILKYCHQRPTVLILDFDQTLSLRHVTAELCHPYIKSNGTLDGVENLLHGDMLIDTAILKALFPPSWAAGQRPTIMPRRRDSSSSSSSPLMPPGSRGKAFSREARKPTLRATVGPNGPK